jgi:NAD(P)-dependent dehydrogenase (short-subunit alcohol dehydrogenase family)
MSDSQKYSSKLHASRILIIGGSSGIGYAVAEACLESGAHVAVSSSNSSRVQSAVTSLQISYPSKKLHIHGLTVDLSQPDTLESELEQVLKGAAEKLGENGKMDHVVFTAGDALAEIKLPDMTYKNVVQAGQVRFFAPLLLAKFLPQFLESSYKSSHTIPNWSVIASYAGGHHSMVRNLALDMKPIRVRSRSRPFDVFWDIG